MKTFELSFYLNGVFMTEIWEGVTAMQARSLCIAQHGYVHFEEVKEVTV